MKKCELCNSIAKMYCDSDQASLCWDCDSRVHTANFLVAKHSRTLLCHLCQSPTPWTASGPRLGPTMSVCQSCTNRTSLNTIDPDRDPDIDSDDDDDESDRDDTDDSDDDDDDDDDGDNQVVPLASSSSLPPPMPSSSSEESSKGYSKKGFSVSSSRFEGVYSDHRIGRSQQKRDYRAR